MIYINRNKVNKPNILIREADDEHLAAHKHYVIDGETEAFKHKLYREPEVKEALVTLFNGKCAYCESCITKTSPIDKDHFRPKTKIDIKTANKIRGYYWLAADWDNLFSACFHCNRTGTHETELKEKFVSGKLDSFPLSDETKRAIYGKDLYEEEKVRLLINPCIDKPETIIKYNENGEILPMAGIAAQEAQMLKSTVETFGLLRSDLHKDRQQKWKDIKVQIERIKMVFKKYNQYSDSDFLDKVKEEFDILKELRSKDKEHLGVVRYVIRNELTELKKILLAIKAQ